MLGMIVLTSAPAAAEAARSTIDPTILLTWLTCLVTLIGGLGAMYKYGRRIMQMVEDFNGEHERPGVTARPGVMRRLQTLDDQVAAVHKEVNYNSGTTVKDAVARIENDVKIIHERLGKQ